MNSLLELCISPELNESNADTISRISDTIDEIGSERDWAPKILYLVTLCVEEIGLNALTHGRRQGLDILIVKVISHDGELFIEFTDNGAPFDPINDAPEPDLSVPLEERSIGGLGIFLIKKMVDEIEYRRVEDQNHLTLTVRSI